MRALIRVTVQDRGATLPKREDRQEYDSAITDLFRAIGFDPRSLAGSKTLPSQMELETSEEVKALFEGLQGTIAEEEKKHLIMLGYTSAGQAKFVVCSINQNVLHIRVRDDLFEKLRLACGEICARIWAHSTRWRPRFNKRNAGQRRALQLAEVIEVMEPTHKTATILGHLIRWPWVATIRYHRGESLLALVALVTSGTLFWYTPELAEPLTRFLARLKTFQPSYVQGALERTYSALLVTFAITAIELLIKYIELRRGRPIMWNAGIEPSPGARLNGREDR
jgi:hypothetical protein